MTLLFDDDPTLPLECVCDRPTPDHLDECAGCHRPFITAERAARLAALGLVRQAS